MTQKLYVEKPGKALGEQFDPAADPPAAGVCTCNLTTPYAPSGHAPHVHLPHPEARVLMLSATDWIMSHRFTGAPTNVLTDAQFSEIYGDTGPPAEEG